jgi:hypothetical protein
MISAMDYLGDTLFVTDRMNQRIQAFDKNTGAYLGKYGGAGYVDLPLNPFASDLLLPAGLAIDRENKIFYVSDGFDMSLKAFRVKEPLIKDGKIQLEFIKVLNKPELGNLPGGLFACDKIVLGKDKIYVATLVSERIETYPRIKSR